MGTAFTQHLEWELSCVSAFCAVYWAQKTRCPSTTIPPRTDAVFHHRGLPITF
jgi:hypothetical protein